MKAKCLGAEQAFWSRQGWVERCGGWVGRGCCGMEGSVEATGSAGQVRWEILVFSSVCKAGAGIQRNLLNIKRPTTCSFSLFLFNNRGQPSMLWYFSMWESDACITVNKACLQQHENTTRQLHRTGPKLWWMNFLFSWRTRFPWGPEDLLMKWLAGCSFYLLMAKMWTKFEFLKKNWS